MALKDLMGRTEGSQPGRAEPATTPAAPAPRVPAQTGSTTFLDSSTRFEGTLHCADSLRIDGHVEGAVYCQQKVAIGETGTVKATIEADTVVVAGKVNGDITARRKVTLEKTGRVTGDLITPGIVIQEGAKLEGRITIGEDAQAEAAKQAAPRVEASKPAAKQDEKTTGSQPTVPSH